MGFPCGSAGKESSCNVGDLGSIPGDWEDPLEKGNAPVFWPAEFHGRYRPWGRKELDTTEQLTLSFYEPSLSEATILCFHIPSPLRAHHREWRWCAGNILLFTDMAGSIFSSHYQNSWCHTCSEGMWKDSLVSLSNFPGRAGRASRTQLWKWLEGVGRSDWLWSSFRGSRALLASWFGGSALQNCERIHFFVFISHPVLLLQPKETNIKLL